MVYRYKTIKVGGKTTLLHRHIAAASIGRELRRGEQVHHRNGDEHDNRPSNLQVMTAAEHQRLHKQKHPYRKVCLVCGATFKPAPTKRARTEACTPACGYRLGWMKRRGERPPYSAANCTDLAVVREAAE